MSRLRELDRRVVPVAARRLRALLDAGAARRSAAAEGLRRAVAGGAAVARRADDRLPASGPLSALRRAPLLVPALGLLVLASGVTAAALLEPDAGPAPVAAGPELGVPAGADVDAHLARARTELVGLADREPQTRLLALVSLSRYLPVAEATALLDGAVLQRAYLRAGAAGPQAEVVVAPVTSPAVLTALCAATSARRAEDARSSAALAAQLPSATPEQQQARAQAEAQAQQATAESQAFAEPCSTAFGLLVEAPAGVLRELLDRPGVRGVEAARPGAAATSVDVQPLLPETTGVLASGQGG